MGFFLARVVQHTKEKSVWSVLVVAANGGDWRWCRWWGCRWRRREEEEKGCLVINFMSVRVRVGVDIPEFYTLALLSFIFSIKATITLMFNKYY